MFYIFSVDNSCLKSRSLFLLMASLCYYWTNGPENRIYRILGNTAKTVRLYISVPYTHKIAQQRGSGIIVKYLLGRIFFPEGIGYCRYWEYLYSIWRIFCSLPWFTVESGITVFGRKARKKAIFYSILSSLEDLIKFHWKDKPSRLLKYFYFEVFLFVIDVCVHSMIFRCWLFNSQ